MTGDWSMHDQHFNDINASYLSMNKIIKITTATSSIIPVINYIMQLFYNC